MRANVKPFTHWVIYKKYKVRFQQRTLQAVTGVLTTLVGEVLFRYDPQRMIIHLPNEQIAINEYGWEIEHIDE